ncbi:hypothetical protein FRC09_004903 [Ceratobasidium sp. 395]|nr:hypothetical protein FRC09_004903 [Ceratobasidium sp. 395]
MIANRTQTPHEAARQHRQWAKRREELIDEIRLLPGMSNFLLPPKAAQLVDYVQDGAVAIVNVDRLGCDAIVIQAGTPEISRVLLGGCSLEKLDSARIQLEDIHFMRGARRPKWLEPRDEPRVLFKDILSMLWYDLVKPVLHHLNITQVLPADDLPHITYGASRAVFRFCPFTPLEITTGRKHALRQSNSAPAEFRGVLAVGHESFIPSRELSALPGTKIELDQVTKQFEGFRCTRLDGEEALVEAVLMQAMSDHSWIHFACHASQNFLDPLNSALHLHDRDLSLAEIYQTPIQGAELAFLSACEMATGELGLPDEVLHSAAGLLIAGYSNVVATMWPIHDADAPILAGKFYECLLEGGKPNSRNAARSPHKPTAHLRQAIGVEEFERWVPYVHMGRGA